MLRISRTAVLGSAAVLAAVLVPVQSWASSAPAAVSPAVTRAPVRAAACSGRSGPYAMRASVLVSCGDSVFPLQRVSALAGGGRSYRYVVDGMPVTFSIPPPGFSALTASAGQLSEYNLPTRAMLGSRWYPTMRNLHLVTPPPFLVMLPGVQDSAKKSQNWAGNAATGHRNYDNVAAVWTEPRIYRSVCKSTAESTWAGIGGDTKGSKLAQDGTAFGETRLASHQAWWEILPAGPVAVNVTARPGNTFEADTHRTSRNGKKGYVFFLNDLSTGKSAAPFVQSSSYNGTTAEVITERPTKGSSLTDLSNFRVFDIKSSSVEFGRTTKNFGAISHDGIYMHDKSGRKMAQPGPLKRGDSWTMRQASCS